MAESGTPIGRVSFRDPFTGRFISARQAAELGGLAETFTPGVGLSTREQLNLPSPGDPFTRTDNPNSTLITRVGEADDNWLQFVEPPLDRDATEFRFVVTDDGYDSGFRTTAPFSADESPADVAERLGLTERVVRVVYGIQQ